MSWMATATSWAPPRLQPDTWVIWGAWGTGGEARDWERGSFLWGFSVFSASALLDAPCLPSASALGLQVWPQPLLSPHGPSSSPSIIATARHPISCPSPSGPGFSDLLIGKGRGDALELSFPHPRHSGCCSLGLHVLLPGQKRRHRCRWLTVLGYQGLLQVLPHKGPWLRWGSGEEQLTAGKPSPTSHFTGLTHSANSNFLRKF